MSLGSAPPLRSAWRWIHRVAAFATVLPLFFAKHLPFLDLPEHLALVATLRHWWDPVWESQRYFYFESLLRTQYWLYHVVGALLAVPLGTAERSVFVLTLLSGLAYPYSLRALARSLDRDPRIGLLGGPFFWSQALMHGLLNFVASIPLALWGVSLLLDQIRGPTRVRALGLSVIAVALFYLHLSLFVFFCVTGAGLFLVFARDVWAPSAKQFAKTLALRASWLLPAFCFALLFVWQSPVTHPESSQGEHAGVVRFIPILQKPRLLMVWMHDVWRTPWHIGLALVMWGIIFVLIGASVRMQKPSRLTVAAFVPFVVSVSLYLLMPTQVGYAFILDLRLAPLVGLTTVLLLHARHESLTRFAFAAIAVVAVGFGLNSAYQMHTFEARETAHFELVLRNLPPAKRLLTLVFQRESRVAEVGPFLHFGSYYRARYGGIASLSFSEMPHWPLRYRPEEAPPKKKIALWDWNPCLFRNSTDGLYYDFILTRGDVDPFAHHPPGPKWFAIGGARDWKLYAKSSESWPEDGPDVGPCVGR